MRPFDVDNEKYHLGHLFVDAVRSNPDAINQIDAATGESETNASVLARSSRLARCLLRFGAQPGDVLALGGRNHLDLHVPTYAGLLIGMPISGVDPTFKYAEIKANFKLSSPKVAFCQKETIDDHLQAIEELGLTTELICFDDGEYSMKRFIERYDDQTSNEDLEPLDYDLDKVYAALVPTGGTSGVQKLAAIKHRIIITKIRWLDDVLRLCKHKDIAFRKRGEYRPSMHLSPIQRITGFYNSVIFPVLHLTKLMTSAVKPTVEDIIDIINKYRPVSDSAMLPFLAGAIIRSKKHCDLSCFDNIVLVGAKPCYNTLIGLRLVDTETEKEITRPNVRGEMWIKGPMFTEYYNNPEETAKAFTKDGWYKTGDIMYQDAEGNHFFVERKSMILRGLFGCIAPSDLEAVIREHSGVHDVCVTKITYEDYGELPVACVVRKDGSNVTAQAIKDLVDSKLPVSHKLSGGVVFMNRIPITTAGKVARGILQQIVMTAYRE